MSAAAATIEGSAAPSASTVAVLIVNDNASRRLALSAVLAPLGHEIVEANSGRAALRCVMAQQFAVILLDVRMPLMNGFETAAAIRQRQQSELTPIIFITAHTSDELNPEERYAGGAVDFLYAPVRPEELRAKVSFFAKLFRHSDAVESRTREVETASDSWRLVLDLLPVGVFRTDRDDRHVYTNERWTELTGMAADDVVGRTPEHVFGLAAGVVDDGVEVTRRFELRSPGVPVRAIEMTSRRMPEATGSPAGWVGTLDDVTTEVAAAAALAAGRRAVCTMQDDLAELATAMIDGGASPGERGGGGAATSAA